MPKTCPICGTTYPDSNVFCPADGTTLRADEEKGDLIGSVIADRYKISKLLGEGGMGRVYLAQHVRLPQQSAIKVLHPSMLQDSAAVQRFNREAANAAKIEHDRVARVFDFGETSTGLVYIAMEYVPGRALREIQETQPRLSPVRAANLIYQVAEGLDAAHRMSIVHRDLKPDNIMVITDENGIDRAKVVDFGIAKAVDANAAKGTQLTQAGSVIGTPEFMSPEQVFGEQLDARSDVYALALVGFQMFAGELPFDSSTPERSLTARIVSDPRTLAAAAPDVEWPTALQDAFDRALAREPDARTASALDFADAVVAATEAWQGVAVLRTRTPLSNPTLAAGAASISAQFAPQTVPTVEWTPDLGASTGGKKAAAPATAPTTSPTASKSSTVPPATNTAPTAAASTTSVLPPASTASAPVAKKPNVAIIAGVLAVAGAAAFFVLRGSGSGSGSGSATTGTQQVATAPLVAGAPVNGTANGSANTNTPTGGLPSAAAVPGATAASPTKTPSSQGGSSSAASLPATASNTTGTPTETPAANASSGGPDPQRSLDSLKKALNAADEADAATVGKAAIPQLQALLPRLKSAADSTWAYVYMVNAYVAADDATRACGPLRSAKRLATSEAQLRMITAMQNSGAFVCAP